MNSDALLRREFGRAVNAMRWTLPVPRVGDPISNAVAAAAPAVKHLHRQALVKAAVLALTGMSVNQASDLLLTSKGSVQQLLAAVTEEAESLGVELGWRDTRAPLLDVVRPKRGESMQALLGKVTHWVATNPLKPLHLRDAVRTSVSGQSSGLVIRTQKQFQQLMDVLEAVSRTGIQVLIRYGSRANVDVIDELRPVLDRAGFVRHPYNGEGQHFATAQFIVAEEKGRSKGGDRGRPKDPRNISPRAVGRIGQLVVTAFVVALVINREAFIREAL